MSVPAGFGSFFTGSSGFAIPGIVERNPDATLYVGNLDTKVDEEVLWELFIQCGPLTSVSLPRDRVTSCHQGYAFVEYKTTDDADYAIRVLNMIRLFGKPIRCNKSAHVGGGGDRPLGSSTSDVGANVFVGGLAAEIDEAYLQDTFSAFGRVLFTKVMRDPDSHISKGFGFVSFDSFTSADGAIKSMNGQYLGNKPISVSYAQKKDTSRTGQAPEFHGTAAERLMASLKPKISQTGVPMPPPPGGPMYSSYMPPPPPPSFIR
jgi:splicing factor 3B subunit 4